MSMVFNRELETAIKAVYTQLEATELAQENLEKGAKLALYFAHGITDKAAGKLTTDQVKSGETGTQLKEATTGAEVCNNIVTAATAAATDARNTNSLASTAAVNIQAAADALANLTREVTGLAAFATSKNKGDKIQHLLQLASQLTQQAADQAEDTTLTSLNTTIEAAQSRAAVSLDQSKTLVKDIKSLISSLNQNFEALQTKVNDDSAALATAVANENQQEGIYKTALEEERAMQFSEKFINKQVNRDLRYIKEGTTGEKFTIAFNAFEEQGLILKNGDVQSQKVLSEYRIIFAQYDDSKTFDLHAAKATTFYHPIKKIGRPDYSTEFYTAEYIANLEDTTDEDELNKAVDYTGQALQRGVPYVAFVYLVYQCDYQNEMDDTDGFLSLPSLPFTLLTDLPAAGVPILSFYKHNTDTGTKCSTTNAFRVSFRVNDLMFHGDDLSQIMDFRVILFKAKDRTASAINHELDKELQQLFLLDEQYRIREQAYLDAEQAYNTAVATGNPDKEELKEALAQAEQQYKMASQAYDLQQERVDFLNGKKPSNFFIDRDVLKSIPLAFGQNAELLDEAQIRLVEEEVVAAKAEAKDLNAELDKLNKMATGIQKDIDARNKQNNKTEAKIEKLQKQLKTNEEKILLMEGVESTLMKAYLEIDNPKKIERLLEGLVLEAIILEELKKLFKERDDLKKQIRQLELEMSSNNAEIQYFQKELKETQTQIAQVEAKLNTLEYNLSVFEEEVKELRSSPVNSDLEKLAKDLADMTETLEKMKESDDADPKDVKKLEKELKDVEKQIKKLEEDLGSKQFIAINDQGDFTDNYGEPLIHGEAYTALVYSVIKPTEPDALPLFRPMFSPFSKNKPYLLPQL